LSSRGPSILGWMAAVRRMRCISIHPVRVGRSDGEDRAMTGDSGTLRPNLRRFKSKVLLDSARPEARVVQQAGSVVLRIDDLSMPPWCTVAGSYSPS